MISLKNKSQPNREILGILSNLELVKKGNSQKPEIILYISFHSPEDKIQQSINPQSTHLKSKKRWERFFLRGILASAMCENSQWNKTPTI
jgi:hypothetical protein